MGDLFQDELKKGVKEEEAQTLEVTGTYVDEEFDRILSERNSIGPVMSKEQAKRFKQEIKKQIEGNLKKLRDAKIKKSDKSKETTLDIEKEDENVDSQAPKNTEKPIEEPVQKDLQEHEEDVKRTDIKSIGYLDSVEMLRIMKNELLDKQITEGRYAPDEKEYYKVLLVQKTLENERKEYIKGLNEDAKAKLLEIEEKNKKEELAKEKQIRDAFNEKIALLSELNEEMKNLNEQLNQLYSDMEKDKIDPSDPSSKYKEKLEYLNSEISNTVEKIQKLNPIQLEKDAALKERQDILSEHIMGEFHQSRIYSRSSTDMQDAIDNKKEKQSTTIANLRKETEFNQRETFVRTLELNKEHLENLKKQYDATPETDIDERAKLLQEITTTTKYVESYEILLDTVDKNMEQNVDSTKDIEQTETDITLYIEEVENQFEPINNYLEEVEVQAADEKVEDPTETKKVAEGIAKEVVAEKTGPYESVIPGLEGLVASEKDVLKYDMEHIDTPIEANLELKELENEAGVGSI